MGVRDSLWMVVAVSWLCVQALILQSQGEDLVCNSSDSEALVDLMNNFEYPVEGWGPNASANCCNWPGVACNSSSSLGLAEGSSGTGRVVELVLASKKLAGSLPDSLGRLDQLRLLNLSRNLLKSPLPESLLQLPSLQVLDLSYNEFSGPLPGSANLPSLHVFNISENAFKGSLPVWICANSTRIQVLNLAVNFFSDVIPPGLGNCSSLRNLSLATNNLTGGISEDIFTLGQLVQLSLQENSFSGPLSSGIRNLTELIRLDISTNGFSGSIPDVFQNMKKLQYFIAQTNGFAGSIPSSLSSSPSLTFLNLRNNSLMGTIVLNCSALSSLVSLDLGSNNFSGPFPADLPNCRQLQNVNLARNKFTTPIPQSFENFSSLVYLSISNSSLTNLSSALGILQHCGNLTVLVLTLNYYDEELPGDASLSFPKLEVLIMASGRLRGPMPQWVRGCTRLQLLDLSWNKLGGKIPPWMGDFQSLFYLDLSNNSFVGEIPKEITRLPGLINRNLSMEERSPDFPLFMKRNVSVRGLQYNQVTSFPPTLDLGCNHLNGSIWPEFGNLKNVHILDLRNNLLSGSIPESLSGMTSLETLDLSYNKLSGSIPSSLVHLNFLSKFSVAYNNLSGPIPNGGQFPTFPNSSFEGTKLCGDHAPHCPGSQNPPESADHARRNRDIGMVIGIAFGATFLVALMVMILMRAHRRGEVDPEKEVVGRRERDIEELESRLLVMFQHKDSVKLSYEDISRATGDFDQANIIGCGGFGMVYRAAFPDGTKLAIKKLSGDCGQMEREFSAEVETLSRAQHPNLVHLQGFCMDKDVRLLIYSYMENGSLDYWLHEKPDGPSSLDWCTRLRIAQGAARGLAYLHQSCEPHIVHRDVKSSNILLDENFEAHLADFGLARLICAYETHVTTDLVGTLGYIPPEYGMASVATCKGDVYSFGVVLLELVTGKRPMDMCKPKGSRDLISRVIKMKGENRESEVFDCSIYGMKHDKEILLVFEIACLCLNDSPKVRPSTQQLVSWLDCVGVDAEPFFGNRKEL
ncbi:phytosulfokine receptor 1-like [Rhodamnia argentea]|uniref:non-specific serine/threonine protein kinase n=1 Tax=Rhodamnia argentea TaxID=178133 RepID=A0A8B8NPI8_9MYRT|nr:phytosulfokine receptor 1-like [Rhodamnia argentea]